MGPLVIAFIWYVRAFFVRRHSSRWKQLLSGNGSPSLNERDLGPCSCVWIAEGHLRRRVHEYLTYYHDDRTHIGLQKATPANRPVERRQADTSEVQSEPRIGGLHHRYRWTEAA
jgi:hypothetical protein